MQQELAALEESQQQSEDEEEEEDLDAVAELLGGGAHKKDADVDKAQAKALEEKKKGYGGGITVRHMRERVKGCACVDTCV